ncbi:MAG: GT4 family glycosyltransferase PelF [Alphaproteobacteria bacterium]|nr:GT4 family glycosyltransferase PelF [Alphaproteobacteria bacterium]
MTRNPPASSSHTARGSRQKADVCLILEGSYPYVTGGVSGWAHGLLHEQSHLSFHICAIMPRDGDLTLRYDLPSNVVGLTTIRLNDLPTGAAIDTGLASRLHRALRAPLANLTGAKPMPLSDLKTIMDVLRGSRASLGTAALLDREEAWKQLVDLYESGFPDHSFLDYFWSYRAIAGGLYSVLLAALPQADIYHAMSTGYAGLMAARAKVETGKPVFVTEHGIYTNERRIEVTAADWLEATSSKALTIDKPRRDLRDMWIDSINNFSRVCYEASDRIITLFAGNQKPQLEDGAPAEKLQIIPNGVDIQRFGALAHRRGDTPTIGFIGRVVPIKDVKTFIRACGLLRQTAPEMKAYIIGPTDEDADYYTECTHLVQLLGLEQTITFTGQAKVDDYLPRIDVLVLTSISEAQPLVMLEAGAAGIPIVATDVGSCRELIEGTPEEAPHLGMGGIVTPLASPAATADAVFTLLSDTALYDAASTTISTRVAQYYNEGIQHQAYRTLYAEHLRRA